MSAKQSPKSSQNGSALVERKMSMQGGHTCCRPTLPVFNSSAPKLVMLVLLAHLVNCQQQQQQQQQAQQAQQHLVQVIAARRLATTSLPVSSNQISSPEPSSQPAPPKSASTSRASWVERILIRVGRLHLENRQLAYAANKHNRQDDELSHEQQPHQLSSLAPTDTDQDDLFEPAAKHSSLRPLESNEPPDVIESNDLVQAEQPSRLPTSTESEPIGCKQAYTNCAYREQWCGSALKAFTDDCADLIGDQSDQCSPRCLRSMIALRSSDEGRDLARCQCDDDDDDDSDFCERIKARSQLCQAQVDLAVDSNTTVSCSIATAICMADQACSTALDYYYANCQSLFSQRHCTPRCSNSLAVLYRQPKASKLINCQCDGSEDFACVKYKTYTERLCLRKSPQASAISSNSASSPGMVVHNLLILLVLICLYCYTDVI